MANTINVVQVREDDIETIVINEILQASSLPVVIDFPGREHEQFTEVFVFATKATGETPVTNVFNNFLMQGFWMPSRIVSDIVGTVEPEVDGAVIFVVIDVANRTCTG